MSKSRTIVLPLLFAVVFNPHSSPHAQQPSAANNRTDVKRFAALAVLPQAKVAAFRIEDHFQRDALLQLIGVAEAKAGDLDAAVQTANKTSFPPTDTLDAIGEQLAQTNDLATARVLGRKLKDGGFRALLSHLVDAQATRGDITGALKTVDLIGMKEVRSYALERIAIRQAANGDYAGARTTYSLARKTYPSGLVKPDDLEMSILASRISRGEIPAARAAIASLESPDVKFAVMLSGAEKLWEKGDQREADKWLEDALKGLPAVRDYDFLRYVAIPVQVKLGQKDSAMLAAGALPTELRAKGYMAVAITCAETKDAPCVNASIEQMRLSIRLGYGSEDYGLKLMTLSVTAALIDNDQFREADRILRALEQQNDHESFKLGIEPRLQLQRVLMLARDNKFGEARSLALKMQPNSITSEGRGTALRFITLFQTKMNGTSHSLPWARRLKDAEDRAYGLLGIAQGLLEIGEVKLRYGAIQIH